MVSMGMNIFVCFWSPQNAYILWPVKIMLFKQFCSISFLYLLNHFILRTLTAVLTFCMIYSVLYHILGAISWNTNFLFDWVYSRLHFSGYLHFILVYGGTVRWCLQWQNISNYSICPCVVVAIISFVINYNNEVFVA